MNELVTAANNSIYTYEQASGNKTSLFFHEDAIRHLARLTRVLAMQRSHALLLSTQFGLGRTSLVRFAAHLSKMKYFEPRTSYVKEKSEEYLKSILRQCCLLSGIKGSHSVIYIKMEYYSYKIIDSLSTFVRTGKCFKKTFF